MLLVIAGGSLLVSLSAPAGAAPGVVPVFALRMDQAAQPARVTEGSSGTVQFTGQMTIDKLPVERCVVTLTSSTDTGWSSQVAPTTAVFTGTAPQRFSCTVIVPQGTPAGLTGNLTVRGRAVESGHQMHAEARAVVAVAPFFRLELSTGTPVREVRPGEPAYFTVRVANTGNSVDTFELDIGNREELAAGKWTVVFGCATIPGISTGESRPVRICARSPGNLTFQDIGTSVIIVKATSRGAGGFQQEVSATIRLTVHVRDRWSQDIGLSLLALSLSFDAAMLAALFGRDGWRCCPG